MTPYEINKAIAKLKFPGAQIVSNETGSVRRVGDSDWWHWATDIGQAWELFEEMPLRSFIKKMDRETPAFDCLVYLGQNTMYVGGHGDTAPRAICMAWLKWKICRLDDLDFATCAPIDAVEFEAQESYKEAFKKHKEAFKNHENSPTVLSKFLKK